MEKRQNGLSCPVRQISRRMDSLPLAMSYIPWQSWEDLYKPEEGLTEGTIFMQLNKPFTGRRWGK